MKFDEKIKSFFQSYNLDSFNKSKSLSEALIFVSTNPQYDDKLNTWKFQAQNMGRTCCVQKLFLTFRTIYVHSMFSPCSKILRASDKDLPVLTSTSTTSASFRWGCQIFHFVIGFFNFCSDIVHHIKIIIGITWKNAKNFVKAPF